MSVDITERFCQIVAENDLEAEVTLPLASVNPVLSRAMLNSLAYGSSHTEYDERQVTYEEVLQEICSLYGVRDEDVSAMLNMCENSLRDTD